MSQFNFHVAVAVNHRHQERWFADAKEAAKFAGEHSRNETGFVFEVSGSAEKAEEFRRAGEAFFRSRESFQSAETRAAAHRVWCNFCAKHNR